MLVHQEVKDAGIIYCRCGISRPTLCKWIKRYKERGEEGLKELSRRPHTSPKEYQSSKRSYCPIKYLERWKNNVAHNLLPMKQINQIIKQEHNRQQQMEHSYTMDM